MFGTLRPRLTYANVMATAAVFIALGGTSYAVATGSIDSREIKNNTIRGEDIRRGTVKSSDVGNFSLLAEDFRPGQLPAGPQGPKGAIGPAGKNGATQLVVRVGDGAVVSCLPGERATGGGGNPGANDQGSSAQTTFTHPLTAADGVTPIGWVYGTTGSGVGFESYVICARP